MPVPPDPAMPGLLDLLTVRALSRPVEDEAAAQDGDDVDPGPRRSGAARTMSGSSRLWVEVEA